MTNAPSSAVGAAPWRQTAVITIAALAVFALLRWLPLADGSLHYSDFGAGDRGFLEFCEPGSPQFAPVDRIHSPVTLELMPAAPMRVGVATTVVARLATANGKPIAAEDLLEVHTRKLHLLLIDPTLTDYQHVHPEVVDDAGTFSFSFTPRRSGRYRAFADFMPRATGRALYAGAALEVAEHDGLSATPAPGATRESLEAKAGGLSFRLTSEVRPLRINQTAKLVLTIGREQGGVPLLEDVMGAPAHLVAFDEKRTGFAHLHPAPPTTELPAQTDAGRSLAFSIHLPDPGRYRLWAQVQVEGREIFAPFDLLVEP